MEVIVDPLGDRVRSRAPPGVTATSATATSRKRAGEIAMGSPSLTCPLLRPLPRTPSHGTVPSASGFPVGAPGLCASAAVTPRARVPPGTCRFFAGQSHCDRLLLADRLLAPENGLQETAIDDAD